MRWLGLGALFLLAPAPAHAQVLIGILVGNAIEGDQFHVGIGFGGNLTRLGGVPDSDLSFGPHLALFGEYRFAGRGYLFTEVAFSSSWGLRGAASENLGDPPPQLPELTDESIDRQLTYLVVPLIIKGTPDRRKLLHLGLGPQLMVRTGARDIWTRPSTEDDLELVDKLRGDIAPADIGVAAMVEVKPGTSPWAISFELRAYQGFVDVEPGAEARLLNQGITGGILLPLGRPPACPTCDEQQPPEG